MLIFAGTFLLGIGLLLTPSLHSADVKFSAALVNISHTVIQVFGGKALRQGAVLRDPSSGFAVEMRDGCNAVNVTLLLWSAVLAFPAPWRLKGLGLLAGSLIIQALNIVRFISLFYLGQFSFKWFELAHGYLWESLLILDTVVIFWLWVNRVSRREATPGDSR